MSHPPVTLLFVPGHRENMLSRARESGADAVVFDLEDSVPEDSKDIARKLVSDALDDWPDDVSPRPFVRINPPRFRMTDEDANVVAASSLAGIVIAKVDRPVELDVVLTHRALGGRETIVTVETPRALLGALDFADYPGVSGLCLGGEDLALNMGLERTTGAGEFTIPRFLIVAAATAASIWSFDVICPEFRDLDIVTQEALSAKSMGFDGKFAIHPAQIEPIRNAFMPDKAELQKATRIVDAYDAAVAEGNAAVAVDGQMIDPPVAERFRRVVERWT